MTFLYQNKNNFFLENRLISKFETRKTETSRAQMPSETVKAELSIIRSKNELEGIREKSSQIDKLTERQARALMRKVATLNDDLTKLQDTVKNSMDIPLGKKKDIGLRIRKLRTIVRNIENRTQKLLQRKGVDIYLQGKQYIDKLGLPTKQWLTKFSKLSHKEQQRILDFHINTASINKLKDFWNDFGVMDYLRRAEGARIDFKKLVDTYRKKWERETRIASILPDKPEYFKKNGLPNKTWTAEFRKLSLPQQRVLLRSKAQGLTLEKDYPLNYFWEDFIDEHKVKNNPNYNWSGYINSWSPV